MVVLTISMILEMLRCSVIVIAVAKVGGDDMSRAMMTVVMKCMLRIWSWRR